MSLRLSAKCGDSITTSLASSLMFGTTLTSSDLTRPERMLSRVEPSRSSAGITSNRSVSRNGVNMLKTI